ncbi:MAG: TonB-dependent receptor [Xanthobacteraceae bacterium]|nr:MAG: TonB-dependent receptor [Xanthobacteraceae bacterium]
MAIPEVVVTADRSPESIERTGSAINVVHGADLAKSNPLSMVDALRAVPGLDVTETGGPGATASVRLRGTNPGQTLVLIDGVRANDPGAAGGDYDFSMFPAGAIDRVEVLRGPQSALYGSDAIGGVINIITKKGSGPAQFSLQTEAGSYRTAMANGSLLGSQGPWSYAVTAAGQRSDGFSRYGYRIPAIEARFPNLDSDGFDRMAGSARLGYDAGQGYRAEAGLMSSRTRAAYDQATGAFPDTPSEASRLFQQGWGRVAVDTLGGAVTHSLNVFANRTERVFNDVTFKTNTLPANTTSTISEFIGERVGSEYQANIQMGAFGSLVAGAKIEHENAATFSSRLLPTPLPRAPGLAGQQETHSAFALWQIPIMQRLILSAGGRVDDVVDVDRFATWRTTAAYLIPETGSKLRASAGTGGKAPTLYQLYAPTYGNPNLQSEESIGWDAGIDQSFLNGRATVSVTGFNNRLNNLIEFDSATMRYFNVARAATSGVEVGAELGVLPGWMVVKVAYTYLDAKDLRTNLTLQRRPPHSARVAFAITPLPQWLIEPRVFVVSRRFSGSNETSPLAPYARLDIYTDYRIDANWRVFARMENVTDTPYQEVLNYGTTGRAFYGGFNVTW